VRTRSRAQAASIAARFVRGDARSRIVGARDVLEVKILAIGFNID